MVQGYLFSAPTPGGAMEVLLRDGLPLSRMPAAFSHPAAATTPPAPPTPDPEGPLPSADSVPTVTLGEAAEALSVSVSTLRRWADAGRIAAVRTAGGHRRFPVSEVRRLNQESALAMRPIVRAVALDGRPLPALAGVLEAIGPQARDRAVLAVYETGRLGWFVSDAGSLQLGRFERALAGAARSADWPAAIECSRELLLHAHYAGASLLERHTLLERYADLTCRLLADRDAERPEIVSTRRLFARLRQALLSDPGGV
jgi:excisionase family DNA binding protein